MIYFQLFLCFLKIGLFSIGGGYAAIPLIEAQAVEEYRWLTMSEFADLITIAEMTPGPIAVNSATFVGLRIAGIGGAIAATFGCIAPSLLLVSLLSYFYRKYRTMTFLQAVLASLRPAVVALIATAGLGILDQVLFAERERSFSNMEWVAAMLFLVSFLALRKWKANPILVMLISGVLGVFAGFLNLW